ncbi:hypothetical protein BD410DRAFT_802346 [Rickenella mellea]|uniref:Uncharacterized protein n=1 Tax=Rickenella mellea TaxID=50990 RepID=A0A4Y7Q8R2_9AGAM|nr:hypothetical protein BD410DRAFT_802346 [Rickenella mellea]
MIHKNRCYDQATADKATPAPIWHMASTPNSCQTGAGVAVQIFSSFALRVPAHLSCERPLQSYGVAGFVVSICIQVVKARVLPLTRESYRGLVKREQRNMVEIAPSANPLIFFAWNLEFTLLFSVRSFTRFCLSVNTTDRILPRSPLSSSPKYHEYLLASLVSLFVMGNIVSTTQYQCAPFSPASLTTSVSKPRGSGRPQGIDSSPASPQEDHGDGHVVTGMKRKADVTLAERPAKRGLTLSSFAQRMTTNLDACLCRTKHSRRKNMAFAQLNRTTTPLYHRPTAILWDFVSPIEPSALVLELRTLMDISPLHALPRLRYFAAIGFTATPQYNGLTIDLDTTSSFDGLMVWRHSSSFQKIDHLRVRLSAPLDLATYETKILRFFFQSLPHQQTHVEHLSIRVQGLECYQLIRLLAEIHNSGVRYFSFRSSCPEECNPPMSTPVIGGTLSDLEGFDLQMPHPFLPIQTWMLSSIIPSAATLQVLSVTCVSLDTAQWRQLLLSRRTFPTLKQCTFDISISFQIFMDFVRVHPFLERIAVSNGKPLNSNMDLHGGGAKLKLPMLRYLDGPAAFLVALFNHLKDQPPGLSVVAIRPDGDDLQSSAVDKVLGRVPRSVSTLVIEFGQRTNGAVFAKTDRKRLERSLNHISSLVLSQRSHQNTSVHQLEDAILDNVSTWAGLFPALTSVVALVKPSKQKLFKEKLLAACTNVSDANVGFC